MTFPLSLEYKELQKIRVLFMMAILKWHHLILNSVASSKLHNKYHKAAEEIEEELRIIDLCKKDPERFSPIYLKYHDQIFLFINRRVDHLDLTADLTSRTFLNCLKNISKFNSQGVPFSSWLYRIAINEVNMYYRKSKNLIRSVSVDDHQVVTLIDEIDYSEPLIDSQVLISVLLEQLNEYEIQFIELRFFENQSFKEIGFLLGLTEVNAKIKTYRILKKLKKLSQNIQYN